MKINRILFLVVIISLFLTPSVYGYVCNLVQNPFNIKIDGSYQDIEAYNINGYTYFKLRDIGEKTGFNVDFKNNEIIIKSNQNILMDLIESTCLIKVYDNEKLLTSGSGTFINNNRILTNKHLIKHGVSKYTININDIEVEVKLLKESLNFDLAIFETVNYSNDKYVDFTPRTNNTAITISNPNGIKRQINYGEYLGFNIYIPAYGGFYTETTNDTRPGSSGGLLIDGNYNCYGVVTGKSEDGMCLSVMYENIIEFLKKNE